MLDIPIHPRQGSRRLRKRSTSNTSQTRLPRLQRRHSRRNGTRISLILQLKLPKDPNDNNNATINTNILDLAHLRLNRILPNRRCHLLTLYRDINKKSNERQITKSIP